MTGPCGAGHQNRFDLGAEYVPVVEGNPHRAPAHKGIVFLRRAEIRESLVAADIEGADGDRMAVESLDDSPIKKILVIAVGKIAARHVGEFGAVEADPFGAIASGQYQYR